MTLKELDEKRGYYHAKWQEALTQLKDAEYVKLLGLWHEAQDHENPLQFLLDQKWYQFSTIKNIASLWQGEIDKDKASLWQSEIDSAKVEEKIDEESQWDL